MSVHGHKLSFRNRGDILQERNIKYSCMQNNRDIAKEITENNQQIIENKIKIARLIENQNEPMYINPPRKILLSNLMFSFVIIL